MTLAAATLRERIEQAPNTAALLALIDSLADEDRVQSWVLAAEHFPHVDGPFTAALLRAKSGEQESYVWAAPALTRNRHITRGQIDVVLGMIASELTTTTSADRARLSPTPFSSSLPSASSRSRGHRRAGCFLTTWPMRLAGRPRCDSRPKRHWTLSSPRRT